MSDASLAVRTAIYFALTEFLENEEAIDAVDMWKPTKGHENNPLVGLNQYCQALALRFGLQGKESQLHLSILNALNSKKLIRQPSQAGSGSDSTKAAFTSITSQQTSSVLIEEFFRRVERYVAKTVSTKFSNELWRKSLIDEFKKKKNMDQAALENWLLGRTSNLQGYWPARKQGTQLLNTCYVVLAKWVGPVKADACFMAIVQELEQSSDRALQEIRKYL